MQFYFLSGHGGQRIVLDWLTCPSSWTENNIHGNVLIFKRSTLTVYINLYVSRCYCLELDYCMSWLSIMNVGRGLWIYFCCMILVVLLVF